MMVWGQFGDHCDRTADAVKKSILYNRGVNLLDSQFSCVYVLKRKVADS